jgi:hypothetical protein
MCLHTFCDLITSKLNIRPLTPVACNAEQKRMSAAILISHKVNGQILDTRSFAFAMRPILVSSAACSDGVEAMLDLISFIAADST